MCVINMKGGVGKSTVAFLLGRYASARLKRKVLVIDLDPQANLSQAIMGDRRYRTFLSDRKPSIVEVFSGYMPPAGGASAPGRLGGVALSQGDNLELIPSRFDFSTNLVNGMKTDERMLARCIADRFQDKDLVIMDCSPTESVFTRVAYHASRFVLVPVRPEYLATIGFPLLRQSLDSFRNENRGHEIDVLGIVINDSYYAGRGADRPEKRASLQEIRTESKQNNWRVFDNEIPFSLGFPKWMRGDFTYSGNAYKYEYFAEEFFKHLDTEVAGDGQ